MLSDWKWTFYCFCIYDTHCQWLACRGNRALLVVLCNWCSLLCTIGLRATAHKGNSIIWHFLSPHAFPEYSPWPEREICSNMKVAISPKRKRPHPPKLVCMHAYINPYLHEFFEPILFNSIFWSPWTIVHGPKGNIKDYQSAMGWRAH